MSAKRLGRKRATALLCAGLLAVAGLTLNAAPASATDTGQTSSARPAVQWAGGEMYVGWTGTDHGSHLNVGETSWTNDGNLFGFGTINTLSDTAAPGTGPAFTAASVPGSGGSQIIVAWAGTDAGQHIWIGHYNGTGQLDCHTELPESTGRSPALISNGPNSTFLTIAWQGLDSAHHLNIGFISTTTCPAKMSFGLPITLNDTTIAGPALTLLGGALWIAWTGTDVAHHIYTGAYAGVPNLDHHTCLCSYASGDDLALATSDTGTVTLGYQGTDDLAYTAQSTNGTTYTGNHNLFGIVTPHGLGVGEVPTQILTRQPGGAWVASVLSGSDDIDLENLP